VREMADHLDPALIRDLTEAKAALARHGIVIIRSIETELEPALVAEAKNSIASSPSKLAKLKDDDLDRLMADVRKASIGAALDLKKLYIRLLAKLGTDYIGDLVKELDGIDQLFKWERVAQAAGPVSKKLEEEGFGEIVLSGPRAVSDNFAVELGDKWPQSFSRFRSLADLAAKVLEEQEKEELAAKAKKGMRKG